MGRITNPKLFLLKLQLCPNDGQEKEQDEDSGSHSPKNTCSLVAHAVKRRGLYRHLSQETPEAEGTGGTNQTT